MRDYIDDWNDDQMDFDWNGDEPKTVSNKVESKNTKPTVSPKVKPAASTVSKSRVSNTTKPSVNMQQATSRPKPQTLQRNSYSKNENTQNKMAGNDGFVNRQSKQCSSCQSNIPLDSRFCPECRALQSDANYYKTVGKDYINKINSPQNKKRNIITIIIFSVLLAAAIAVGIISSVIKPTINLDKYVSVKFEGYNNAGKAYPDFDYESFYYDYGNKMDFSKNKKGNKLLQNDYDDEYKITMTKEALDNYININLDKQKSLKNGDAVNLTWICDDNAFLNKYNYKIKYSNQSYTVSGLTEVSTFDPFEGIDVIFEGIDSQGCAEITGEATNIEARDNGFVFNRNNDLKNGDTVVLSLRTYNSGDEMIQYYIDNYGRIPLQTEKEYVVSGLTSYVKDIGEISEETLSEMKKQAEDTYKAYVAQSFSENATLSSLTYIGNYLQTIKGNKYGDQNIIYLVYKPVIDFNLEKEEDSFHETKDSYWWYAYNNIMTTPEGKNTFDINTGRATRASFTVDSGLSDGWFSTVSWGVNGYDSIDNLFNDVIEKTLDTYEYVDNIDHSLAETKAKSSEEESTEEPDEEEPKEESVEEEDESNNSYEGMVMPEVLTRELTREEVEDMESDTINTAINDILAKNGIKFSDKDLKEHYSKFDWYKAEHDKVTKDMLTDIELANYELLDEIYNSRM